MQLEQFLASKPLYYRKIDRQRMPRIYQKVAPKLSLPKTVIQIVGTNGKGSTGRFLAQMLQPYGTVGHYTSPHILHLNERFQRNGSDISNEALQGAHLELLAMLDEEDARALSYFEYTTILAMVLFARYDFLVLEAGLGGKDDATSAISHDLLLCTTIDLDHQAFLGDTVDLIAANKVSAVQKEMIIGRQKYAEVMQIACNVVDEKQKRLYEVDSVVDEEAIASQVSSFMSFPTYQKNNFLLAAGALKQLGMSLQANTIYSPPFGRLSQYQPNIWLDVGHNLLAAEAVRDNFAKNSIILVYNSLDDKPYEAVLAYLKPIVQEVQIIEINNERAVMFEDLVETLRRLQMSYSKFHHIDIEKNYLVFGSFSVVEAFLKREHG